MVINQSTLKLILLSIIRWRAKPSEIASAIDKNRQLVQYYLKYLVEQGLIEKHGNTPHVHYELTTLWKNFIGEQGKQVTPQAIPSLDYHTSKLLQESFLKFDSTGQKLEGTSWFIQRCHTRGLDPIQKAKTFVQIGEHIESIKNPCGVIDATGAFTKNLGSNAMDKVFYADQYHYMEFWRGKLAELTFYAKQSQNKQLIEQVVKAIILQIECVCKTLHVDAIAIVPRSIQRQNQLLSFLGKELQKLWLPFLKLVKFYPSWIPIPQKTLKTREQRIQNAISSIDVKLNQAKYNTVLLIDDFVGSGATLNISAQKIKQFGFAKEVIWLAIVGNIDLSYEVINEI